MDNDKVRCLDCEHRRSEFSNHQKTGGSVCYVKETMVWHAVNGYMIKPDRCSELNAKGNCPFFSKKKSFLEKIKVQKG